MTNQPLLQIEDQPARVLCMSVDSECRVFLARVGYEVLVFDTSGDVLDAVELALPDAIVVGVSPDVQADIATVRAIKQSPSCRDLPVFGLIDQLGSAARAELYDAGFDCLLVESATPTELVAAIRNSLRQRRMYRTLIESSQDAHDSFDSAQDAATRYQSIFDEALDAIFVVDATSGAVRASNSAASALCGLSKSDLDGRSIADFCPLAPRAAETETFECEFLRDGEPIPVLVKTSLVRSMTADFLQYTIRDLRPLHALRDRRMEEERLAAVLETAVTANEELNTPLTVIITSAESLRRTLRGVDSKVFTRLDYILEAAKRARSVLNMLMQVRRASSKEYLAGTMMLDLPAALADREKGSSDL